MSTSLIDRMFLYNMDYFLQRMFLYLDPASLKTSRCVSRQWNCFIQGRIWNSKVGRRVLKEKMKHLWKTGSASVREFAITEHRSRDIEHLVCDESSVYCITVNEAYTRVLEVYDIYSGDMIYELEPAGSEHLNKYGINQQDSFESIAVGEDILVAATACGKIFIAKKDTGEVCFKANHRSYVDTLTVMNMNKVVIGGFDGSIVILGKSEAGFWEVDTKFDDTADDQEDVGYHFRDVAISEDLLIAGNAVTSKVWRIQDIEEGPEYRIGAKPHRMILDFPFLFVIGGAYNCGFEVWNVETNKMIRDVPVKKDSFYYICSNGDFVAISTGLSDDAGDISIIVFDAEELEDTSIVEGQLWRRTIVRKVVDVVEYYKDSNISKSVDVCLALTKTGVVLSCRNKVQIVKFWAD